MKQRLTIFILFGMLLSAFFRFPLSGNIFISVLVWLFLLANLFSAPWIYKSGLLGQGYGKVSHWLVKVVLLIYIVLLYDFTRVWTENLQHAMWNVIIDNVTDLMACGYSIAYVFLLVFSYLTHNKNVQLGKVYRQTHKK